MEALVAIAIGAMTAAGVYLVLRLRTFPTVIGMTMMSYAINIFLVASGRLAVNKPPILDPYATGIEYTDPLPQALTLTAIVISFGMTAVVVLLALGAYIESGDDYIDMPDADRREDGDAE
ncbi:multicomponent K+:H+ antiporter subunit C [Paracoccus isoporae]|uniref:Multicomponent K+:H+ antiporter subunit C n=1 Tax=Paracoccus isoporae TaxID=591205 RepID=A0A1G6UHH6_9RHOB|nr:Na+/H+ antiporter subunit C [Paracoccus isoporae]SDD40037.1 multicomponent K+:H+ antiporter subunit C [Paracoccus isoporae]